MFVEDMCIGQKVLKTDNTEDSMSLQLVELNDIVEVREREVYYDVIITPLRFKFTPKIFHN